MKVRHLLSGFSLALLAACGDKNGLAPSSGDQFSEQEAVALVTALNGSLSGVGTQASAATVANAGASVPQTVSASVSQTVPCPLGGQTAITVRVNGTIDDAAQSANLNMSATNAPSSCVVPVGDLTVTLSGRPRIEQSMHLEMSAGQPVGTWTAGGRGSFDWTASDGRAGMCSLDYTMSLNFTTQQVTLNGSFCGASVTYSGPIPTSPA